MRISTPVIVGLLALAACTDAVSAPNARPEATVLRDVPGPTIISDTQLLDALEDPGEQVLSLRIANGGGWFIIKLDGTRTAVQPTARLAIWRGLFYTTQ